MLRNNIDVELCLIEERGAEKKPEKATRKRKRVSKQTRDSDEDHEEEVIYVESEDEHAECGTNSKAEKLKPGPRRKRVKPEKPAHTEVIRLE